MTADADQRISALEREVRGLKMQLAHSRRQFVAPPPRDEPTVRVLHPVRRLTVPTDGEFARLLGIVVERYPQLRSEYPSFQAEFCAAWKRLQHIGRRDRLDTDRGLGWWLDDAAQWLRENSVSPTSITGPAFVSALVAQGDVGYAPLDNYPCDLGFALQFGGGGRPASNDGWRHVLQTGNLRAPTPLDRPIVTKSPSRVRQIAIGLSGYR